MDTLDVKNANHNHFKFDELGYGQDKSQCDEHTIKQKEDSCNTFNLFPDSNQLQSTCVEFTNEECIGQDEVKKGKYSLEVTNYPRKGH